MKELFSQCEIFKNNKNFEGVVQTASAILTHAIREALEMESIPRDYSKVIDAVVFVTQRMPGTRYKNTAFSEAYCILGKIFETGVLAPENKKKAREYYAIAADHSNPFGCYRLAHFYENGIECTKNMHKAAHYYKLSANGGCCRGLHRYGLLLLEGRHCKRDVKGGVFYLEQAKKLASQNYPHMLYDLGVCYEKCPLLEGHILEDQEYALSIFQQGDALGCARSSVRLGNAYNTGGLGLPQDTKLALHYYMRGEAWSSEARFEIYRIYASQGNQASSLEWLKKAAEMGHPEATHLYAQTLERGVGVEENKLEALWWYTIAKTKGVHVDAEIKRCRSML
ncbi:uncharacterized protein NEMAJ01_1739 [Nematocida major]|uniref:uncharacterized protein n=1 Tax=Nematocida major TaxID=1912982 RepID=UPI002007ED93|nr:uncharacterized protein NEMAJ01_1739 [Nematocida major]KAH9386843.1 uncharacterized protein NEMAJ01_1739 [Nematocida major]